MSHFEEVYNKLLEADISPTSLYYSDGKSVAEAYFEMVKNEKREMARVKYFVHADNERRQDVPYLEDTKTEYEIWNMPQEEMRELFAKNNNEIYTCYDTLINMIASRISRGLLDHAAFCVYLNVGGKAKTPFHYTKDGQLCNFPIGYFTGSLGR